MSDTTAGEIRDFVHARVAAIAARDAAALQRGLAPDVRAFNVLPPIELRGRESIAAQTENWFSGYENGPGYAVYNLEVEADEKLGYCSYLYHVSGALRSGADVSMWVRATLVLRKGGGGWSLIHDHESVPWDPQTGQGVLSDPPDRQEPAVSTTSE